eukprot:7808033-Prorocentrum_lima.AAC.1
MAFRAGVAERSQPSRKTRPQGRDLRWGRADPRGQEERLTCVPLRTARWSVSYTHLTLPTICSV